MENITLVVDTREQLPYVFTVPTVRGTLQTGDYSLVGAEKLIAIERKTLDDLVGCFCSGRERFEKELYRSRALDYFAVVVECILSDLIYSKYHSQMTPRSAVQSLLAFSVRYRVPFFFAETRGYGARITESLLLKYGREMKKRADAIGGVEAKDAKG